MPDDLIPIASFETPLEAHEARGRLATAGIPSQVSGESAVSALAFVGTALGGVKLLVWKSDVERAFALLYPDDFDEEENERPEHSRRAWKCPRCRERNEPAFDLCWSCGAEFDGGGEDEEGEPIADGSHLLAAGPASFIDEEGTLDPPTRFSPEQASNPYAPGRYVAAGIPPTAPEVSDDPDPELEALITRAWRAAILGMVMCPIPLVLQFYSMWLLVCASSLGKEFDPRSNRWFYATLAVDVLFIGFCGVMFWLFWLSIFSSQYGG